MRMAVSQAIDHCRHRKAFGALLIDQPIMTRGARRPCDRIRSGGAALTMRVARALDQRDDRTRRACAARVAIGKYWIASARRARARGDGVPGRRRLVRKARCRASIARRRSTDLGGLRQRDRARRFAHATKGARARRKSTVPRSPRRALAIRAWTARRRNSWRVWNPAVRARPARAGSPSVSRLPFRPPFWSGTRQRQSRTRFAKHGLRGIGAAVSARCRQPLILRIFRRMGGDLQ